MKPTSHGFSSFSLVLCITMKGHNFSNFALILIIIIIGALVQPIASTHRQTLVLPDPPPPDYAQCQFLINADKYDCFPERDPNPEGCEARGCCWIPAGTINSSDEGINDLQFGVPSCFYPPNFNTYYFLNVSETDFGLEAYLKRNYRSAYPDDAEILKMIVKFETDNRLHVKFVDPLNTRYEAAYPAVPFVATAAQNLTYIFELDTSPRPGFKVVRNDDDTILFDANHFLDFTFANQFLQISSTLPSKYIYGIGEHTSDLLLNTEWSRYSLWNHDIPPNPNLNLYGSHPFYMVMEESGKSHGVFLLNSNAMDVLLQPTPAVTFRTIGGVLDFYFFMGPTPSNVIAQYTELVGLPHMPPYWGFGYHLCRFGYRSLDDLRHVMESNINAGVPIDTQWTDLDAMKNRNDFTYDKDTFAGLPEFVNELHERGMHYIPLIDPGISGGEPAGTYPPFDIGVEMDVFVKNSSGGLFFGKVWNPVSTVWPDFTHLRAGEYWTLVLKNFHDEIPFDGAWIDMNDPSNAITGSFDGCPDSNLENPPYMPYVDCGFLNCRTLCLTAKHYAGTHYDLHNLYGIYQADVTNAAMTEIRGKRPMIISRSTSPGFGRYAGHWSGDVLSTWAGLKESISQLLSFSMFGVPLMGADICGFNGDATPSLCSRWHQLAAFYPFSRNHNADNAIDQDPVSQGELVVASASKAFKVKYALLPYLYTLFYRAHVFGDTVARPLFFEFASDHETFGIDREFLWGGGLLIVPVLEDEATSVEAYLPQGIWYDYYSKDPIQSKGEYVNISAPLDTIPLFLRGGHILAQQEAKNTTTETRKTKIQLLVAPDENGEAHGELFWDDGDSLNTIEEKNYSLINFTLRNTVELFIDNVNWAEEFPPNLGSITVFGVESVRRVLVSWLPVEFTFDAAHKCLTVDNLDISFEQSFVVAWE